MKETKFFDSLEESIIYAVNNLNEKAELHKLLKPKPLAEVVIREKEEDGIFFREVKLKND